jgi:hypothetical protein
MNRTLCPMCQTACSCLSKKQIRKSINLCYQCERCGLAFTLVTSANAWNVLNKIKLGENENGNNFR